MLMNKILVANRGEIAVRVLRTAREQGYRTVAVYSDADAQAPHVRMADEAVCIGGARAAESYLDIENILRAIALTGADAVHPGYGFLSENAAFARACAQTGVTFIGPSAEAIELMGSKRLSKLAMQAAGVPCIPGYEGAEQSDGALIDAARKIGFPVMVKASAGGGGRGMRLVSSEEEIGTHLASARSEATSAFGSGELILEKALLAPRHIEVQVFADQYGNTVYLGERDCSVQRRHQKIIEEAPSPFVDDTLREAMGRAAVRAAQSCDYIGAGTVEFLVDAQRNFYFLEMNTRLQVEHPVTEMVTGLDLVALQLQVAEGKPLPLAQEDVRLHGHAVEVRLYAEDPRNEFLPQSGRLLQWYVPELAGVRLDSGVGSGSEVTPFYDPMLAKLVAWGEDRTTAIRRLGSALAGMQLVGVHNNRHFLQDALQHPVFVEGQATTAFVPECMAGSSATARVVPEQTFAIAAALLFARALVPATMRWPASIARDVYYRLDIEGQQQSVQLSPTDIEQEYRVTVGDDSIFQVTLPDQTNEGSPDVRELIVDGVRRKICSHTDGVGAHEGTRGLWLDDGCGHWHVRNVSDSPAVSAAGPDAANGIVSAPMDGAIVALLVEPGARVVQGDTVAVLEAMKMEHPLKAGRAGNIKSVDVTPGQQIKARQQVAVIAGEEADG
ncbi:geranyl-CoA carboxylase subunit apha [Biformimicrobium ophioploci]|uniref:Geranyl-CoA carboxylase subunit apha n=2 Tax=Biformimicrobium ophioploci TaxID=3036711 RepID=A0ABQ6LXD8_9GAMM|nr:geranyl-CoA carboxylase subunit apha [Microbulbifer sp. NKW57]